MYLLHGFIEFLWYLTHCRLVSSANSLDPDQKVGHDLDPNYLIIWWYSSKNFFNKANFEKKLADTEKCMQNYTACNLLALTGHLQCANRQCLIK